MTAQTEQPIRLLSRASESRCAHCPPERVCAWACIQGAGVEDILIGAVLEQSQSWALDCTALESEEVEPALWDAFNE
jgi:hypothetical protein